MTARAVRLKRKKIRVHPDPRFCRKLLSHSEPLDSVRSVKQFEPKTRPAEFRDAPAIFKLIKSYPQELVSRSLSDIMENIDRFIVCEAGGRIVGTVSWQILPEIALAREPDVEIKSLAVRRSLKRRGIGRLLVNAAIERIRVLHPSRIIALTFTPGFFRKLGFRGISKRRLMHKIYIGCVNCPKYNSPLTCPEKAMVLVLDRNQAQTGARHRAKQ